MANTWRKHPFSRAQAPPAELLRAGRARHRPPRKPPTRTPPSPMNSALSRKLLFAGDAELLHQRGGSREIGLPTSDGT